MSPLLDIRSLNAAAAAVFLSLAFGMLVVRATRRTYPGFELWVAGACCAALATAGLSVQGWAPVVTVVPANALMGLYTALTAAGLQRFFGAQPRWLLLHSLVAANLAVSVVFTFVLPSVTARMVLATLLVGAPAAWSAVLIVRGAPPLLGKANLLVAGAFAGLAGWCLLRALVLLPGSDASNALASNRPAQALLFAALPALAALVCFGLTSLNLQRVEHNLEVAAHELRLLRGVIPICAGCKRVRDGDGPAAGWMPLDEYVRARSQAEFSHGLCPACARRLYPEAT